MGISSRLSCTTCKSRTDNLTSNGADLPRFGEIPATPGIRFTRGSSFFFHPLRELPGFQFRVEVGLDRCSPAGNDQDSFGQESGDGNVAEALVRPRLRVASERSRWRASNIALPAGVREAGNAERNQQQMTAWRDPTLRKPDPCGSSRNRSSTRWPSSGSHLPVRCIHFSAIF